ncbi:Recombinase zinc beta ribbon domain-containing protein [Bradyrhizobium shewense]|uniref:Recombinase zinc beta ribbon domain-containing protein n=1 Tax=Bradyrhizobium shewense TaxID=1761772 RepID=A0A1C3XS62_9BRAD|nr:zinc ribbon domain-containing protein [Bradyrhizobium shewense]SCB55100.1 Recombinase zinc beta ribbon domain-containing protein [Bradyrhizobium shewense]
MPVAFLWNRQTFIKYPETGKQARREERGGPKGIYATRPKHLLSGLIKCGCCGSGYIVGGNDKRGSLFLCSRMKETGLCQNRRSVAREAIEQGVLRGIEEELASPELIAEYVREYQRISRELNSSTAHRRRDLEKRLGNINAAISRAVDALLGEAPSRALRDRLASLEMERDEIEGAIAEAAPPAVELHPNAGSAYRDQMRNLKKALAESDEDSRAAANEAIREIVEKVVIHPSGPYKPVRTEIYGQLAALLRISERAAEPLESRGRWLRGGATPGPCGMVPKTRKTIPSGRLSRHRKNRWLRGHAKRDYCDWSRELFRS